MCRRAVYQYSGTQKSLFLGAVSVLYGKRSVFFVKLKLKCELISRSKCRFYTAAFGTYDFSVSKTPFIFRRSHTKIQQRRNLKVPNRKSVKYILKHTKTRKILKLNTNFCRFLVTFFSYENRVFSQTCSN